MTAKNDVNLFKTFACYVFRNRFPVFAQINPPRITAENSTHDATIKAAGM